MKPAPLRLVRARTLDDVWRAFADASGDAKVIAGGQSLVALLNLRLATPHTLIDLSGVESLRTMTVSPSGIRIGAMVAQRVAEYDTQLRQEFPVLPRAVSYIGHPQIRSRGTIGGNVAHADPASELPALVVLADATLCVTGPHGSRDVPADQFFHGPYSTSVGDDEILEQIVIGEAAIARRYAMHEIARCRGAFAMAGAIGSIGSTSADVRIALFGVGSTPISVDLGETGLIAQWGDSSFDDSLRAHYDAVLSPNDDFQATAEQRRSYAAVCTKKVLNELLD